MVVMVALLLWPRNDTIGWTVSSRQRWECAKVTIPTDGGGGGDFGVREWCRCGDKGIGCCQEHNMIAIITIIVVPMDE